MIEHTVTFRLADTLDPEAESRFLQAANELAQIEGVHEFAIRRQVSPKSGHSYGITMKFESPDAYEYYNTHSKHQAFVEDHWLKFVDDFQEADFVPLDS